MAIVRGFETVRRAIPPDLTRTVPSTDGPMLQHEAIGDLHLAADDFSGAIEEFVAALSGVGPDAPAERCRLLVRLAEAMIHRGDYESALRPLREARGIARLLREPRVTGRVAARLAHALTELG